MILIADDQANMRLAMSSFCRRKGFECVLAENGAEAAELARSTTFDLIITDYEMPKMNGIDLCRDVRAGTQNKDTPLILCAGALQTLDTEAIENEIGRIAFVAKPFDLTAFTDLIQTMLTPPE